MGVVKKKVLRCAPSLFKEEHYILCDHDPSIIKDSGKTSLTYELVKKSVDLVVISYTCEANTIPYDLSM